MLETIPPQYVWIIVGLVIMSMELFLPGFILCFFGLGAVLTGLLMIFVPMGVNTQLVVFAVLSIVLLVFFRRFAQGYFTGRISNMDPKGSPMENHAGETAIVTEDIVPNSPRGKVEFNGTMWNADSDVEILKGVKVTIMQRHGLTFKVKP